MTDTESLTIAITNQNRRTVTAHAGRCRRFRVFTVQGTDVQGSELLELDIEHTLHACAPGIPEPLQRVDILVGSGMCDKLVARLARHGITAHRTTCESPEQALQEVLAQTR